MAEEPNAEVPPTDPLGLAGRAREIMDRAARLMADAEEAARAGAELTEIERRLAGLEEEQRRLDQDFVTVGATTETAEAIAPAPGDVRHDGAEGRRRGSAHDSRWQGFGSWAGNLAETILGNLGSSLGDSFSSLADLDQPGQVLERELEVRGAMAVRVESFAGPVGVSVGSGSRVTARAEVFGFGPVDGHPVELTVAEEAGQTVVRCSMRTGFPGRRYVKLHVTVPPASALWLTTAGGRVTVEDVGGPATLRTAGGSIRLRGAGGDADLATAGGGIDVQAHRGGGIRAVTMGGSITLRGDIPGPVEAQTSGGSIRVDGAGGTVRAHTAGGSVSVAGRVRGDWSLRTAGGSVTASVPDGTDAVVDATGGSVSTDFEWLRVGRRHLRGHLGAGSGPQLTLRSLGGSVTLRRSAEPGD